MNEEIIVDPVVIPKSRRVGYVIAGLEIMFLTIVLTIWIAPMMASSQAHKAQSDAVIEVTPAPTIAPTTTGSPWLDLVQGYLGILQPLVIVFCVVNAALFAVRLLGKATD